MKTLVQIKNIIIQAKEGIIIGAIAGFITAKLLPTLGITIQATMQPSVFEQATGFVITNKIMIGLILIGALIGGIIDLYKNKIPLLRGWL